MKIAVTSKGTDLDSEVDPRFGRAAYILIVDPETLEFEALDNKENVNALKGAGIQAGQNVVELGAEAVVTGNVGPKAYATLQAANVKVYIGASGTVAQSLEAFKAGKLQAADAANVQGHWA